MKRCFLSCAGSDSSAQFVHLCILTVFSVSEVNGYTSRGSNSFIFSFAYICKRQSKLNSLTTQKQTTKFLSANFQKNLSPSYIISRIQRLEGKLCRSR